MSKTRACYNCLHYEQVPMEQVHDERITLRGFAPRCTKGFNPALESAPPHMPTRWDGKFEPDTMAAFCDSYLWAPVGWPKLRNYAMRKANDPRFTTADLPEKFVQYFERREMRIKVEQGTNWTKTDYGRVGISVGWKPVFLLIKSDRQKGSSVVLTDEHRIVALKRHDEERYKPVL